MRTFLRLRKDFFKSRRAFRVLPAAPRPPRCVNFFALPLDVPEPVEGRPLAFVEEGAEPVRAAVPLVAVDVTREQFVGDGCLRHPQRP